MDVHDINMNDITLDEITDQVDAAIKEEINNNDDINEIMCDEHSVILKDKQRQIAQEKST